LGWDTLRDDDRGQLLEHLVLGELVARFGLSHLHYWRDKQRHEVDFAITLGRSKKLLAMECKSSAGKFDSAGLQAFRRKHPVGPNLLITLRDSERFARRYGEVEVDCLPYSELSAYLDSLR
jgi:predicted AAA+ superfamily ATPase